MSDSVKYKSKTMEHSTARHGKKNKSKKSSRSSSNNCAITSDQRNSCSKEKRLKSRRNKRRRISRSASSSSDSSTNGVKLDTNPKQPPGGDLAFCTNVKKANVDRNYETIRNVSQYGLPNKERMDEASSAINSMNTERRAVDELPEGKTKKKEVGDRSNAKKSRRRRRSRSSSTSDGDSSQSSSNSESSSTTSASSTDSEEERRKRRKKKKKLAKKLMKRAERKRKEEKRKMKKLLKEEGKVTAADIKREIIKAPPQDRLLKDINVELADRARAMAPMTREQWEKKQSVIRRVYDEETGRQRLIKGDGEVLEEIVSRDRHMAINKQATKGDGEFFQSHLRRKK